MRDAARLTRTPDDDPIGEPVGDPIADRAEGGHGRVAAPDGSSRSMVVWFRVAVLVSLVPVVSAGVRDALRGWIPTHDGAAMSLKAEQVFSHHPPMIGMFAPRKRLPRPVYLAMNLPSESTNTVSWPPTVATGVMGTPERMACRTKPLRPPRMALSRLVQCRIASTSPPGQTMTSCPAANAELTPFRDAGMTPTARK